MTNGKGPQPHGTHLATQVAAMNSIPLLSVAYEHLKRMESGELWRNNHAAAVVLFSAIAIETCLNSYLVTRGWTVKEPRDSEFFTDYLLSSRRPLVRKLEFMGSHFPELDGVTGPAQKLRGERNAIVHPSPDRTPGEMSGRESLEFRTVPANLHARARVRYQAAEDYIAAVARLPKRPGGKQAEWTVVDRWRSERDED